jgi:hypothetical protein
MDAMSVLMGGGGDISGAGGDLSGATSFGDDPFKNSAPLSSSGPDAIGGGGPSPTESSKPQSTFSSGMDKLNQGIGGLAASEGQTGSGVDINSGNHGG